MEKLVEKLVPILGQGIPEKHWNEHTKKKLLTRDYLST